MHSLFENEKVFPQDTYMANSAASIGLGLGRLSVLSGKSLVENDSDYNNRPFLEFIRWAVWISSPVTSLSLPSE